MNPMINLKYSHPFNRSGLAAVSDLETKECQELFGQLERQQDEFLAQEYKFRSPEYKWPRTPLHTWSRVWEYPYAYHHLKKFRSCCSTNSSPRVVDLGSGVTFFPFAVARLGYDVICTDIDPVCASDIPRAAHAVAHAPGSVDFRLIENGSLPFRDGEIDAIYCISVLEHIPNPEQTVLEMARVLKPGGICVLTIDLDLRGDSEIGFHQHKKLVSAIESHFDYHMPESTLHPTNQLDNTKGPCRNIPMKGASLAWFRLKQQLKPLFGRPRQPLLPYLLAIQGFVLERK